MKKVKSGLIKSYPPLKIFILVQLDSTDYGMITVFAIFGTLIAIGTVADGILNIMKLEIVPEKFLRVALKLIEPN